MGCTQIIGGDVLGLPELDDLQGRGKDAGLDNLRLCSVGELGIGQAQLGVELPEGGIEFTADAGPFGGAQVVVLEEEDEGRGAQEGGVLAVQLGLAELWGFVRGWLGGWEARDGLLYL